MAKSSETYGAKDRSFIRGIAVYCHMYQELCGEKVELRWGKVELSGGKVDAILMERIGSGEQLVPEGAEGRGHNLLFECALNTFPFLARSLPPFHAPFPHSLPSSLLTPFPCSLPSSLSRSLSSLPP